MADVPVAAVVPSEDQGQTLGKATARWAEVFTPKVSDGEGTSLVIGEVAAAMAIATARNHDDLTEESRALADQHPIGAITGLMDRVTPATQLKDGIMLSSDKKRLDNARFLPEGGKTADILTLDSDNAQAWTDPIAVANTLPKMSNTQLGVAKIGEGLKIDPDGTLNVISGGGGEGGTTVHNNLTGRDVSDAHPISAITDLDGDLADLDAKISSKPGYDYIDNQITSVQTGIEGLQTQIDDLPDAATVEAQFAAVNAALNGKAPLVDGIVPPEYLPADLRPPTKWYVATVSELTTLTNARIGDYGEITTGDDEGDTYELIDSDYADADNWIPAGGGAVLAVNGKQGAVTLDLPDFPGVQTALSEKAALIHAAQHAIDGPDALTPGMIGALPVDGTATAAAKLATAQTISLTGGATGAADTAFDGTTPAVINVTGLDASKLTGTAPLSSIPDAVTAAGFVDCTATYASGVFSLTPKNALPSPIPEIMAIRFTAPADYSVGDSVALNNTTYPIQPVGTTALAAGAFVAGNPVELALKGGGCFFKAGGGSSGGGGGDDSGWLIYTGDNPPSAGAVGLNLPNAVTPSKIIVDAEAYIATGTNYGSSWVDGPGMTTGRDAPSSSVRADNGVMVIGGYSTSYLSTTEVSDSGTGSFVAGPSMTTVRMATASSVRADNGVMVIGGSNTNGPLSTTEVSASGTGSFTAGPRITTGKRYLASSVRADNGVMAIGGYSTSYSSTTEVSDSGTGSFVAGPSMIGKRMALASSVRADNGVMVIGGRSGGSSTNYLSTTEVSASGTGSFTAGPSMTTVRDALTSSVRADNGVMAIGGSDTNGPLSTTEVSASGTGSFIAGPSMTTGRDDLASSVRADNGVMVIGGGSASILTTEVLKTLPADSIYPESTLVIKPAEAGNRCKLYESDYAEEYQYIGTVFQTQNGKDVEQAFTILN